MSLKPWQSITITIRKGKAKKNPTKSFLEIVVYTPVIVNCSPSHGNLNSLASSIPAPNSYLRSQPIRQEKGRKRKERKIETKTTSSRLRTFSSDGRIR